MHLSELRWLNIEDEMTQRWLLQGAAVETQMFVFSFHLKKRWLNWWDDSKFKGNSKEILTHKMRWPRDDSINEMRWLFHGAAVEEQMFVFSFHLKKRWFNSWDDFIGDGRGRGGARRALVFWLFESKWVQTHSRSCKFTFNFQSKLVNISETTWT